MKFYPDICDKVNILPHYSYKRINSFHVKHNFIIGGRGYGKTYGCKGGELCARFIKTGAKFAWCRTTDAALDKIRDPIQFFGRQNNLKVLGIDKYDIRKDVIYLNNQVAGYLFPIKTFYNYKGADYDCIYGVWDEFMRAKGEPNISGKREMFNDLCESVFRDGGKKLYYLSNSTNQFDEVLQPYNVKLKEYGIYLYREQNALIHYVQPSKTYIKSREESLSMTNMSEHEKDFAFGNKFTDYGEYGALPKARYIYSIQTDDDKFLSIYMADGALYVKTILPQEPNLKAINNVFVNSKVNKLLTAQRKALSDYYNRGKVIFCDGYARSAFQELLPN